MKKRDYFRRGAAILLAGTVLMTTAGCNWFEFPAYVLLGASREKAPAEYQGLADKKVAIFVMTDSTTDFEFPFARVDLGLVAAHAIGRHVKNVTFVDQERIDRLQREDFDWYNLSIAQLGSRFDADRVLYLDIVQFTLLEDNSIGLLRGRILADVRVYELDGARPNAPVYQTEIEVAFPKDSPLPLSDTAYQQVLQQTLLRFGEELALKFHDHHVTL